MNTDMVASNGHLPDAFTPEQISVIRNTIARDCDDAELALFIGACKRAGLDPLQKQIYAMKMGGKLSIQTSIDGFRVIAERSGKYRGQVGPFWCGADGAWRDVWLDKTPPVAAKVGVLHRDFAEPLWGVARFASYSKGSGLWTQMGEVMIAKVAEALALRKAFPNDLSGLYTADEMDQAQGDAPAPRTKPKTVAEIKAQAKPPIVHVQPDATEHPVAALPPAQEPELCGDPFPEEAFGPGYACGKPKGHRGGHEARAADGPGFAPVEPPANVATVTDAESDLNGMVDAIENEFHAKNWKKAHASEVNALDADAKGRVVARLYARFPNLPRPKV